MKGRWVSKNHYIKSKEQSFGQMEGWTDGLNDTETPQALCSQSYPINMSDKIQVTVRFLFVN